MHRGKGSVPGWKMGPNMLIRLAAFCQGDAGIGDLVNDFNELVRMQLLAQTTH